MGGLAVRATALRYEIAWCTGIAGGSWGGSGANRWGGSGANREARVWLPFFAEVMDINGIYILSQPKPAGQDLRTPSKVPVLVLKFFPSGNVHFDICCAGPISSVPFVQYDFLLLLCKTLLSCQGVFFKCAFCPIIARSLPNNKPGG